MLCEIGPNFLGNVEFLIRQTQGLSSGVHELYACFAVAFVGSGDFRNSLRDYGMSHNELRPAGFRRFGLLKHGQKFLHVVAVDLVNVKSVGLEAERSVLALAQGRHGVERHEIGVINQDEIIQLKMPRECRNLGSHPFLEATIAGQTDNLMVKNGMIWGIESRFRHFSGNGHPHRVPYSLAQRSGGSLDSGRFAKFRMAVSLTMQLPEVANIF